MVRPESAEDLRTKIANLKQTRRISASSMRPWVDALIADAEAEPRGLSPRPSDPRPAVPPPPTQAAQPDLRSTYPVDEDAPWQRA